MTSSAGHLIKNFCNMQKVLYDASPLKDDRRTDPDLINCYFKISRDSCERCGYWRSHGLLANVGHGEARKLFVMKSGVPIYGSFFNKRRVLAFIPN